MRATPLAAIRRGQLSWRTLFDSEVLCYPGFIEFCDINHVILTCSADSRYVSSSTCVCVCGGGAENWMLDGVLWKRLERCLPLGSPSLHCCASLTRCPSPAPPPPRRLYKLWPMQVPQQPRFSCSSQGIRDVKVAPAALLLTMQPDAERPGELPLRVLDLEDGSCVKVCLLLLCPLCQLASCRLSRCEALAGAAWPGSASPSLCVLPAQALRHPRLPATPAGGVAATGMQQ